MTDRHHLGTRIIHTGEPRIDGSAVPPIFQSTVFEQSEPDPSYDSVRYPRLNNTPNHHVVAAKLADLEGAEAAVVTASGMAAISTVILWCLRGGGHALFQNGLYGGTHGLVHHQLAHFGMSASTIEARDPASWEAALRPETKLIYVESLTNPLCQVIDHRKVVDFAKQHGLISVIDNTFASPMNFRAVDFGYDIAVHSATKYLNGHSDLCAGAIAGDRGRVDDIVHLLNLLGGSLDAMGCYLLHRGLRTLELRVGRQNETARRLATFLSEHDAVERVHHPTLPDHPDHALAKELLADCGGVLAFEPAGGVDAAMKVIEALELPIHGPSLGGPETLVTRPCKTSHAGLSPSEREGLGIADHLIRIAVGLEHVDDLCADFDRALRATRT